MEGREFTALDLEKAVSLLGTPATRPTEVRVLGGDETRFWLLWGELRRLLPQVHAWVPLIPIVWDDTPGIAECVIVTLSDGTFLRLEM